MTAQLIDGKAIAQDIRNEVKAGAVRLREKGVVPGLATVLVGSDPASHKYVSMKRKACAEAEIESFHHELSADSTQAEVLELLAEGLTNNEIADRLFVSFRTVENHVAAVLMKLDVATRDAAVDAARDLSILTTP